MIRIVLPADVGSKKLPFFLAAEEWIARNLPPDEYFFTWTVDPTVIFGRNQDMESELDLDYCREHGIQTYRRKSGGGCVYADRDNIMFSYVSPDGDVAQAFTRFSQLIIQVLRELDLNVSRSSRNDVLIDGRKVSGCAFYKLPDRSIVHGTLLFDTNLENMSHAITPQRSKLVRNHVQSVSERITTIKQHEPYMKMSTFLNFINFVLGDEEKMLSDDDVREIEQIEQSYYDPAFLQGRKHSLRDEGRIVNLPKAGNFAANVTVDHGKIEAIELVGDFFALDDLDETLLKPLIGVDCSREAILERLKDVDSSVIILNCTNQELADLIVESVH